MSDNYSFLLVTYKALRNIEPLPHFQGVLWTAFFRKLIKQVNSDYVNDRGELDLSILGFVSIPCQIGIPIFRKGDNISVYLQFKHEFNKVIYDAIFSDFQFDSTHFGNNSSIELISVYNNHINSPWKPWHDAINVRDCITDISNKLSGMDQITLNFITPLKINNSGELKKSLEIYNKWLDLSTLYCSNFNRFSNLVIEKLFGKDLDSKNYTFSFSGPFWSENPYGINEKGSEDTLNGLIFSISIKGQFTAQFLERIAEGYIFGKGKRRSHGSGFYNIEGISDNFTKKINNMGFNLLKCAMSTDNIMLALKKLALDSSGDEIQALEDLIRAPISWLNGVAEQVLNGEYNYLEYRHCSIPKKNGSIRKLSLPSILDKLIHKSIQETLSQSVDSRKYPILNKCNYGFRKGVSYKDAVNKAHLSLKNSFEFGLKIDIKDFFPSINTGLLLQQLKSIFGLDPVVREIESIIIGWQNNKISGLPQGSPLSPILSNIYLTPFDNLFLNDNDCIMLRYADDILILFNNKNLEMDIRNRCRLRLNSLLLDDNPDKTFFIKRGEPFVYLGHNIDGKLPPEKVRDLTSLNWQPVAVRKFLTGTPLFITTVTQNIKADNDYIELFSYGIKQKFKWNEISTIIVIGTPSFSQDFIFNTLKYNIDIIFLTVWGEIKGFNHYSLKVQDNFKDFQLEYSENSKLKLIYVKNIVIAKIYNSIYLLKHYNMPYSEIFKYVEKVEHGDSIEQIRGYEGTVARLYFEYIRELVKPFEFSTRSYHPPRDETNALLSLGYTLLFNRFTSLIKSNDIDPYLGFYHIKHGNHTTLASDLMEPFRFISDFVTISLLKDKDITMDDFKTVTVGNTISPRLKSHGFRKFIFRFEEVMEFKWFNDEKGLISNNNAILESIKLYKAAIRLFTEYRTLHL